MCPCCADSVGLIYVFWESLVAWNHGMQLLCVSCCAWPTWPFTIIRPVGRHHRSCNFRICTLAIFGRSGIFPFRQFLTHLLPCMGASALDRDSKWWRRRYMCSWILSKIGQITRFGMVVFGLTYPSVKNGNMDNHQ